MDRFAKRVLWYAGAGLLAVGLPLAVGDYTFDRTFGGQYNVPAQSVDGGATMLAVGALLGALTFAPALRMALSICKAKALSSTVVLALLVDAVLFLLFKIALPNAPVLNGNGGAQLWAGIFGAIAAAMVLHTGSTKMKAAS